ncbi:MAG: pyridoxamine 5'-phosphate oxidase family protein [Anaerolineae bacterium]|nr:pyridoxamine 5'-phosphate oxidase family protein [Anaerolineae bacterium]
MTDQPYTAFSTVDIEAFRPTMKVGLLATVNEVGLPHLTLIASLQAGDATKMVWGQFTEGLSKHLVHQNPKTGFLIMTMDKEFWRGKATFTHTTQQGPDYERYNNEPMFRYNAYFGVHTVYYMDLLSHSGRQTLPMAHVIFAAVQTLAAKWVTQGWARQRTSPPVLNVWTRQLMNKLDTLKFLAYIDTDGYPVIVPVIQAQTVGRERVIFSAAVFGDDLKAIPAGIPMAVFGMALTMEDVLLRGTFEGIRRFGGLPCGSVKIDWVYNSMPPKPQQIYPEVPLEPVTQFYHYESG